MLRAILICAVLASVGECSDGYRYRHVIHQIRRHDAKLDGVAHESVSVIANAITVGATRESVVSGLGDDYRVMASRGKRMTWTNGDESLCVHLERGEIARVEPLAGVPDQKAKRTGYRVLENHLVACNSLSEQVANTTTEKELVEVLGEPSDWEAWDSVLRWERPDGELCVVFKDGLAVSCHYEQSRDGGSTIGGSGMVHLPVAMFPRFRLEITKQSSEDVKSRTSAGKLR